MQHLADKLAADNANMMLQTAGSKDVNSSLKAVFNKDAAAMWSSLAGDEQEKYAQLESGTLAPLPAANVVRNDLHRMMQCHCQ